MKLTTVIVKRWLHGSVQQLHGILPRRHDRHRIKHQEILEVPLSGVQGLKVAGGVLDENGSFVWECKNHAANDRDCPQGAVVR